MEISAVEILFVRRSGLALALRLYRQADLSVRDRFSAAVAADNGAFEVGRPSGIGPTTSHSKLAIGLRWMGRCNFVPGLSERMAPGIVRRRVDAILLSGLRSPNDLSRSGRAISRFESG